MRKNIQPWSNRTLKLATWAAVVACIAVAPSIYANELQLPTAAEVQYFSPEAQQFYAAGVSALDRIDYVNAYSMLSKSAALQPAAVQLNHIVATLATYQGRQHDAEDARDFYQTALNSYQNILRVTTIPGDLRRQVTNEMKLAEQERDNLAQRDVLREAAGTSFFMDYNRKYGRVNAKVAGAASKAAPATTISQEMMAPVGNADLQFLTPEAGGPGAAMVPLSTGGLPGAGPAPLPGMPGDPGMPGQTGLPPLPGAGAAPLQPGALPAQPNGPATPPL